LSAALLASIDLIESEEGDVRRTRLSAHILQLKKGLAAMPLMASDTAVQPLLVGRNKSALAAMQKLYEQGIWVPAIRPPTVPPGKARLRISLSAAHEETDVAQLISALSQCGDFR
jgi:8-amino-7-oxononanoate synthase